MEAVNDVLVSKGFPRLCGIQGDEPPVLSDPDSLWSARFAKSEMDRILQRTMPELVLCGNDDMAIGAVNALSEKGRKRVGLAVQDLVGWTSRFLEAYQEAGLAIERFRNGPADSVARDCSEQIARLVAPRFYLTTPRRWLNEYPRYLKAIPLRFDKFLNGGSKTDPDFTLELAEYWSRYEKAEEEAENAGVFDPELENFRWAIEEYRVSLFAQRLGTSIKVSPVRLEKIWEKVMR